MRPIVFVLDSGADPNFIRASVLYQHWFVSIHHSDVKEVRGASETNVCLSRTTILHLHMGEWRIRLIFGVVDRLVVPVYLERPF